MYVAIHNDIIFIFIQQDCKNEALSCQHPFMKSLPIFVEMGSARVDESAAVGLGDHSFDKIDMGLHDASRTP